MLKKISTKILVVVLILVTTQFSFSYGANDDKTAIVLAEDEYGTVYTASARVSRDENSSNGFDSLISMELDATSLEPLFPSMAGNSEVRESWDSTETVKATIGTRYRDETINGKTYYLVQEVAGGYILADEEVKVIGQDVCALCVGPAGGAGVASNQYLKRKSESEKFSFETDFTEYVAQNAAYELGAIYHLQLVKNSHQWSFTLVSYL